MRLIKWIWRKITGKTELRVSEKWLTENDIKEASEGWTDGPRWRFPAEIVEEKRLIRKKNLSLVKEAKHA